jgi:hypothetical protein
MGAMARKLLIAVLLSAAVGIPAAAAQQKSSRPLVPAGGAWQSVPYTTADLFTAKSKPRVVAVKADRPKPERKIAKAAPAKRQIAKTAATQRHPVPAASEPARPPADTAAARSRELSRRIDVLSPGAKLDEPFADRENPAWRKRAADRAGADGKDFAVPFDDTGKTGIIARGYHQDPAWNNPHGTLGATVGPRLKF